MNMSGQFSGGDDIDVAVRDSYRAGATEEVPGYLDAKVLLEARREAGRNPRVDRWPGWLIPAAFAGVIALSLSFNLHYNNAGDVPAIQGDGGTADLATAVESTGRRLRELDDAVSELAPANNPGISAVAEDAAAGRFCRSEETASPGSWWSCIETLQRTGQADAAQSEIELLKASFPDHLPAR